MNDVRRLGPTAGTPCRDTVLAAWERFVEGEDSVPGVRPEVVVSWHRCREQYRVDPYLRAAPVAIEQIDHTLEHDVVFTELGGLAAAMAQDVDTLNGIVTVTDETGRILAAWGDHATLNRASEANLAPWYCWSECAAGTNGMGTALEAHGPVLVRGAEHWCQAFHNWVCAGVAVRDMVTRDPIAVLNISCWRTALPESTGAWLSHAVATTRRTLRNRARDSGTALVAAYTQARARPGAALAAMDTAGKVVIADETASVLMGVPAATPAIEPTVRWNPGLPDLIGVARYANRQAAHNRDWVGSTRVFTHLAEEPTLVSVRPVFVSGRMVGCLLAFGTADGELLGELEGPARPRVKPPRLVALREKRLVLLRPSEVHLAEADGNDIWLETDEGRLRASATGLDRLDDELGDGGFLRVHRRYLVNLDRVREVDRGPKGELSLVLDNRAGDRVVPVSRRNAAGVRRALGI